MCSDTPLFLLTAFFLLNSAVVLLFWLHEKIEYSKMRRLKLAVESAVRAVEKVCADFQSQEKKQDAVKRVQALLGVYKWIIPELVIDTAIEAELFVIQQMHKKLSVDHDTPDEVKKGEGSY